MRSWLPNTASPCGSRMGHVSACTKAQLCKPGSCVRPSCASNSSSSNSRSPPPDVSSALRRARATALQSPRSEPAPAIGRISCPLAKGETADPPPGEGVNIMKIERIEALRADGIWRAFDFLKITAANGIVGWSEFNQSFGGHGVSAIIAQVTPQLIGKDPNAFEAITAWLYARTRTAQGGMAQQAIAAIENA